MISSLVDFRTLLIGISTGTAGNFLNQLGNQYFVGWRLSGDSGPTLVAYCFSYYFRLCGWSVDQY